MKGSMNWPGLGTKKGIWRNQKNNERAMLNHILLEYNCPIIQVAEKHWEACSTETQLFEKLLDAKVETTHRAAKGDLICEFLIKEKKRIPLKLEIIHN